MTRNQLPTLRRALNRAGISREEGRIGWHDLRHTYASHLAMRGVPLKVIQELMGHVTIEMTERYAHLSSDTRREAVGVLDRLLRPRATYVHHGWRKQLTVRKDVLRNRFKNARSGSSHRDHA